MSAATAKTDVQLAKLAALLASVGGYDKALRMIVYASKVVGVLAAKSGGDTKEFSLAARCNDLAAPLADTRMVLRLFGLLPYIQLLRSVDWRQVSQLQVKDLQNTDAVLQWVQHLSMLVYYPCEHVYWLGAHKVLRISNPDAWSRWSCRAWAVYLMVDLVQWARQYRVQRMRL